MHGQQNIKILSLSFGFRLILLLDDDVFPWFVYAVITLETDALDTPKKVAVLFTDTTTKRATTICPIWICDKFPISLYFHANCHSTQSVMHWRKRHKA